MPEHRTSSPGILRRLTLRVGVITLAALTAGCLEDFGKLLPRANGDAGQPDQTAPVAATDLGWVQASPAPMASLTARWTLSTPDDVATQEFQLYADATCGNPYGAPVSIPSGIIASYNFSGNDLASYSYKVTTIDDAGNRTASDCSAAISIALTEVPSVTLSGPSASPVSSGAALTYTANYERAASVTLDSTTPIGLDITGSANCDVAVSGSGNVERTVTLSHCTGDGTVAFRVAPGTSSNPAGTDAGAGPANPVVVDNTAPIPATSPGWLQVSPSAVTSITAGWTVSADPRLASQAIGLYAGTGCSTPLGPPVALGSTTASTHNFTGNDSSTYSFVIASTDQAGNTATSPCSPALTIHTSGVPTLALSSPSVSRVSAAGTASYALVYTNADAINADVTALSLVTTGSASCQLALRGTGTSTRFSDLTNCAGDGSVAIAVAAGTAANLSGTDGGAGPSTPVAVDNTGPADAQALGWSASSPTTFLPITATWSPSTDAHLTYQFLQLYADDHCGAPDGAPIIFASAVTANADLPAQAGSTYSYRITSQDDLGHASVSPCSTPLIVSPVAGPSIRIANSSLDAGGSTGYQVSGGTGALSVWVSGAGTVTNAGGDGTYFAPAQCRSGTDTLYVSDARGYAASVTVDYESDPSFCAPLQISGPSSDVGPGASTDYSVSGGQGGYSITVDNGWVDNPAGSGNYYAPYGCDGGTATLTVTDSDGATASTQVNYSGDGSQCAPPPVSISVDSSSISGDGSTSYYVSGGSGSYSVSVENLGGSGAVGSIDNSAGSGTYYISPGSCDSGNSGTDQINVSDSNGESASVQVGWAAGTCDSGLSISVMSTDLGPGSSTYYSVSGGTGSYSISVDSGWVDNSGGDGNYYAPYGCDGGTATLTVTDSNGATATTQINYSGDGSQCAPPPVSISVDSSSITGDGSTSYYVSGGSGSYSVSVQNLWGGSSAGWIDNGSGSGTYYVSPGSCDSGYSGTDEITVWDTSDGSSTSVQISWGAGTCDSGLSISVMNTELSPGSSTYYSVSGGTGSYSLSVDRGSVDNSGGDGNYYAPYGCDGGTATLTVTDSNGATATAQVNYSGDSSQCAPPPVSISVDSSSITGDGSTSYYVSGGSGSYKVAVQNLWGSGATGSIDNGGGSGTYAISPGACDSKDSGTDEITVWDSNDGTSASVQISWGAATCD